MYMESQSTRRRGISSSIESREDHRHKLESHTRIHDCQSKYKLGAGRQSGANQMVSYDPLPCHFEERTSKSDNLPGRFQV
jgi:hypothetical protein